MLRSSSSKYQNKNNINTYEVPFFNNSTRVSAFFYASLFIILIFCFNLYLFIFCPLFTIGLQPKLGGSFRHLNKVSIYLSIYLSHIYLIMTEAWSKLLFPPI